MMIIIFSIVKESTARKVKRHRCLHELSCLFYVCSLRPVLPPVNEIGYGYILQYLAATAEDKGVSAKRFHNGTYRYR